ncbi:hypothetical protein SERLADRAFT_376977 [Serpula lacrymans var. lacrymans S7.9]|uniref:Uncharacterized protein n=1 Tax=Serpula lacrymans var. lacrymans (strain S7.9) TaxID=578457 RepID=F8NFA8_SERL9|nr:uncharacterized protein SERLADRAFT_376977 [Serpula lacrymans var. lacrymans S7.9]EGO31191.1 hypothetical protein SERLADRAFT_376977 [Serpula lacrymans var. lacrymans S7.9]
MFSKVLAIVLVRLGCGPLDEWHVGSLLLDAVEIDEIPFDWSCSWHARRLKA